jgi:Na+/phosphate symporter
MKLSFGVFGCCIGLMSWYATFFGRHLSYRTRLGAFIFGGGTISLAGAYIAEAVGVSWVTPELHQKIFLCGFLPSFAVAAGLLPRGFSFFPPHDPDNKNTNA